MKSLPTRILMVAAWSLWALNEPLAQGQAAQSLASGFQSPPAEAKPRVWWHWMDGNVDL